MAKDDRFSMSRNFLATDKVPDAIFGIPVVSNEDDYTPEDLAFFKEHPEAGGYYDMGEETPEDGSAEGAPTQADAAGNASPYAGMTIQQKLDRADELLKQYEGTDKYDAFKKRVDEMHAKYDPVTQVRAGDKVTWDYQTDRPNFEPSTRQMQSDVAQGLGQSVTSTANAATAAWKKVVSSQRSYEAAYQRANTVVSAGNIKALGQKPVSAAATVNRARRTALGIAQAADAQRQAAQSVGNLAKVGLKNAVGKTNLATAFAVGATESAVRQGSAMLDMKNQLGASWGDVGTATKDVFTTKQGWKNLGWGLLGSLKDVASSVTFGAVDGGDKLRERMMDAKGGEARGRYPGKLNNPGNVEKRAERRRGEIASPHKRWAKFATPQDGLREMADAIRQIADVKLAEKDRPFTIRNFAEVYAPRFNEKGEPENDTDKYIRDISSTSGIGADTVLDRWNTDDMARLMKTIVRFESGAPHSEWFTDDEYRTAARELEEGAID